MQALPADLAAFGETHGFSVARSRSWSGQRWRAHIEHAHTESARSAGEVAQAAELLGRPHRLEGVVASGAGRGGLCGLRPRIWRCLGELALSGVGRIRDADTVEGAGCYESVTSVGTNPTFDGGDEMRVETLLLDFEGDLYGSRWQSTSWSGYAGRGVRRCGGIGGQIREDVSGGPSRRMPGCGRRTLNATMLLTRGASAR